MQTRKCDEMRPVVTHKGIDVVNEILILVWD